MNKILIFKYNCNFGETSSIPAKLIHCTCPWVQATEHLTDGKRLLFLDLLLVNQKDAENSIDLTSIENEICALLNTGVDTASSHVHLKEAPFKSL